MEPPVSTGEISERGNFRLLISDDVNAIEDFASVNVTISEIGVQSDGESGNWTEFTPDTTEVDLTNLKNEKALEIWSGNLTAGNYTKVFIHVSEVKGILTAGENANVKLPSGKLQISKPFTVSEDETTSFVYDITVVKAGQSGQYILKPQIADNGADHEFEEVKAEDKGDEKPETPGKPEVLEFEGTIQEIVDEDTWTVEIEGSGNRKVNVSEAEIDGDPAVRAAPLV